MWRWAAQKFRFGRASIRSFLIGLIVVVNGLLLAHPAAAASGDLAVPGGRSYAQATSGQGSFSVIDADGVPLWSEFQRLGGVGALGYPVSRRFEWKGGVGQVFQKGLLFADPKAERITVANLFDDLHDAGLDGEMQTQFGIPPHEWLPGEDTMSWPEVVANRMRLLDAEPRFRQYYDSYPDALERFGLPASHVHDAGPYFSVRLQRAAFQLWKVDVPWAQAGTITVVNAGDIAKTLGLIDANALSVEPVAGASPAPAPAPAASTSPGLQLKLNGACPPRLSSPAPKDKTVIAIDPGHGGPELGSVARYGDGVVTPEKAVNLQIAQRTVALLSEAGFAVVLTRESDALPTAARCDVTGDGRYSLADDLQTRLDIANAAGAAVMVSIHNNGHSNRNVRGTEVYYSQSHPLAAQNRQLASQLQLHVVANLRAAGYGTEDRGIRTDQSIGRRFFILTPGRRVVRPAQMPAALGESLFMTNPSDAAALRRPEIVDAIARGYVHGIRAFLGK